MDATEIVQPSIEGIEDTRGNTESETEDSEPESDPEAGIEPNAVVKVEHGEFDTEEDLLECGSEWDDSSDDPLGSPSDDEVGQIQIKVEPADEYDCPFSCQVCGLRFVSEFNLEIHSESHEDSNPTGRKLRRRTLGSKENSVKVKSTKKSKSERKKDSAPVTKKINLQSETKRRKRKSAQTVVTRKKKKQSTSGVQVLCPYCGINCERVSRLEEHVRKHTGEKPFQCDLCGKNFVTMSVLRRHVREHNDVKPYSCSVCKKSFAVQTNLQGHMRMHTAKSVLCSFCGKAYRSKTELRIHERSHTGEKPFGCELCGKSFVTAVLLRRHNRIHAEHKPYTCPACSKAFAAEVDARRHTRTHPVEDLPLKCFVCSHECANTEELSDHLETHFPKKEKKLVQCETCGRLSRNAGEHEVHLRRHTGERPFKCHCGKGFVSNAIMRKHMRRHSHLKEVA